jgi:hypothetical protein
VIDSDEVERFAVHLPISKNAKAIAGRGTRHSAALGISECSDAFTIVVSEERGVVSVAESGKLREVATAADLKRRLDTFLHSIHPSTPEPLWRRIVIQHGRLKLLAIAIATLAWFVLAYDPHTVQRTFVVQIEYRNVPADLLLDENAPDEARLTLTGSERNFRFLEPGTLKITLDLTDVSPGFQQFPLTESNIRLPPNLSAYRIEPRVVDLLLLKQPAVEQPTGDKPGGNE